jgi:hypothetical protein
MQSPHVLAFAILAQLVSPAFADPALNPEVSQATINDTICAPGYSYTVRPSYWESARINAMLKARGETWLDAPKYELDHIIPLCLGGSPTDPSNLQLEPWDEATRKDRVARRVLGSGAVARRGNPLHAGIDGKGTAVEDKTDPDRQ